MVTVWDGLFFLIPRAMLELKATENDLMVQGWLSLGAFKFLLGIGNFFKKRT